VHDERFAIQANDRVEKCFEKSHVTIIFRLPENRPLAECGPYSREILNVQC
jgi:hypothetical protein